MVVTSNNPPLAKKRTRVKVSKPLSPDTKLVDDGNPSAEVNHVTSEERSMVGHKEKEPSVEVSRVTSEETAMAKQVEEKPSAVVTYVTSEETAMAEQMEEEPSVAVGHVTSDDVNSMEEEMCVTSDEGTGTYNVEKPMEEHEEEVQESHSTDGSDAVDLVVGLKTAAPVPAPRRSVPTKAETKVEEKEAQTTQEAPFEEINLNKTEKSRKKKRKAAEVLASVLRRESKKVPAVATVLQEADSSVKGEEEKEIGSPWDSPPPPKALEKVYIQHKYGFSVRDWCDFYKQPDVTSSEIYEDGSAATVALTFHSIWSRLSVFSHGVVAGVACCHALAVAAALSATGSDVEKFVQFYHFLSLKVHFLIYVFTTLCVVSCFDRLDIGNISKSHLREMGHCHGTLLVTIGYIVCLALSLAAHRHTAAIEAYKDDHSLWDSQGLQEWTVLVTVRDGLLFLCWIFMSCSTPSDLLHNKLTSLADLSREQKSTVWKLPGL